MGVVFLSLYPLHCDNLFFLLIGFPEPSYSLIFCPLFLNLGSSWMVLTLGYPLSNIISSLIKSQYVLLKKNKNQDSFTAFILCVWVWCSGCGYVVYYVCAWRPQRTEEGVRSPGTGVSPVVNGHLGAGNQSWALGQEASVVNHSHLSSPLVSFWRVLSILNLHMRFNLSTPKSIIF